MDMVFISSFKHTTDIKVAGRMSSVVTALFPSVRGVLDPAGRKADMLRARRETFLQTGLRQVHNTLVFSAARERDYIYIYI